MLDNFHRTPCWCVGWKSIFKGYVDSADEARKLAFCLFRFVFIEMKSSRRSNPAEVGVVGGPICLVSAIHSAISWKRWSGSLIEILVVL